MGVLPVLRLALVVEVSETCAPRGTPDDWMSGMPVVRLARLGLTAEQIRLAVRLRAERDGNLKPQWNPTPGIPYVGPEGISTPRAIGDVPSRAPVARVRQSAMDRMRERGR